ncbi:MAG: tRNA pseudouridine synthase [Proteobacteria bacterium]|nr:tRNA pseudouridine synthase [Pseudomonadota bacterium]
MSRKRRGRAIDGMLLLDKGPGMTSNVAVQRVKRLFQAQKAGHTGSLDPIATGLLPICLGEATKFSGFLLETDKRYRVLARLGKTTTTADCAGEILEELAVPALSEQQIEQVLEGFRGPISQVPPMYSALKHEGRRLYELARKGIEVERPAREVVINELRLLGFGPDWLELDVHCSKGTYIRSLVEDIGRDLECGAHVERLCRTAVGRFSLDQAVGLEALEAMSDDERLALLSPTDFPVADLPGVSLSPQLAFFVRRGQPVLVPKVAARGLLRLYSEQRFLGIGEVTDDGMVAPRRMVADAATIPHEQGGSVPGV